MVNRNTQMHEFIYNDYTQQTKNRHSQIFKVKDTYTYCIKITKNIKLQLL